jgi:diketogulonate reductase-like aldo/keto reductase
MQRTPFTGTAHGLRIPHLLYGTAWKEEKTQALTTSALHLGFRGIDTANQRKHYCEAAVGLGIQDFLKTSDHTRKDLFLQTKFTSLTGQDHRTPNEASDPLAIQVQKSLVSSLLHLHTDYLDSYILHGPTVSQGLVTEDLDIWRALESVYQQGKTKSLGLSNVSLDQLQKLYDYALIKPLFVQNRCFAARQWDRAIRDFCKQQGLIYQGFSLLTANDRWLSTPPMQALAQQYNKTMPQIVFRFAQQIGILPLTGTTHPQHMRDDLTLQDFELTPHELQYIENIAVSHDPLIPISSH